MVDQDLQNKLFKFSGEKIILRTRRVQDILA